MKVTVRIKAKQGFRPSLPGYMPRQDMEGTLVGEVVVLPPGPTMNGVPPGYKKAPWLTVPLSLGLFEVAMSDEDPTPALRGEQAVPAPAAKGKAASKEA